MRGVATEMVSQTEENFENEGRPDWADSIAVCEGLHRREAFERLPVVFLCAKSEADAADLARRAGASAYFLKPIDADRVASRLLELVTQTRALRA